MELTFGYVLGGWLMKAGSTRTWVEFVLTSVDSGWGQQINQGLENSLKGLIGTFWDFCWNWVGSGDWFGDKDKVSECCRVNKYEQKLDPLVC
eukprot:14715138-Ditylum_brightwellii.AAC.1